MQEDGNGVCALPHCFFFAHCITFPLHLYGKQSGRLCQKTQQEQLERGRGFIFGLQSEFIIDVEAWWREHEAVGHVPTPGCRLVIHSLSRLWRHGGQEHGAVGHVSTPGYRTVFLISHSSPRKYRAHLAHYTLYLKFWSFKMKRKSGLSL